MGDLSNEWYVGWGTLALINAGLAQGKGGSGLGWFLVSLLLGPIATLLIVVIQPEEKSAEPGDPESADRRAGENGQAAGKG